MRREFPRTTQKPRAHPRYTISNRTHLSGTVRTENVLLLFPVYCTTSSSSCQEFFYFFQKTFQHTPFFAFFWRNYDTTHDIIFLDFSRDFYQILAFFLHSVSFYTKICPKNRLFWIFTFCARQGIILKLSAAPTPQHHAQQSHDLCGVSILWYQRASVSTVVLFLSPFGGL